jgi:hypothetical protein
MTISISISISISVVIIFDKVPHVRAVPELLLAIQARYGSQVR